MTTATPAKRILIIEDDRLLAASVRRRLEWDHVSTKVINNGLDGLETARTYCPDAIVLDLLLPGMNGFDILRNLKNDDRTRNISVMILTNLNGAENVNRCQVLGAATYLVKPEVTLQVIIDTLNSLTKLTLQPMACRS